MKYLAICQRLLVLVIVNRYPEFHKFWLLSMILLVLCDRFSNRGTKLWFQKKCMSNQIRRMNLLRCFNFIRGVNTLPIAATCWVSDRLNNMHKITICPSVHPIKSCCPSGCNSKRRVRPIRSDGWNSCVASTSSVPLQPAVGLVIISTILAQNCCPSGCVFKRKARPINSESCYCYCEQIC